MLTGPIQPSRAPASWVGGLLRPLAADEAGAKFWVRHLRVGIALSELSAFVVLIYVILADRPHRTAFLAIALLIVAGSPLLLLLPVQKWSANSRGPLLFYLWSIAVTLVIMVVAMLDGGVDSPLMWLFVLTMTFAALAYPPLGVTIVGALMVGAYFAVALFHGPVETGTYVVAAVLVSYTGMTAWVAFNHWDTYEQQQLLTIRHAELDQAREEFIATTSHEVRTPVASILGYVELLEDPDLRPEEAAKFLTTIRRNAYRLRELSEDLLVLSRWETEERRRASGEKISGDMDLVEIARRVAETLAPLADTQGVTLDIDGPNEPVTVSGSAEQVERAVLNLASNAVKYTPAGGHVVCTTRRDADEAVITVQDTGIGIADEELKRLFTRFFRASSARARSIAGVGLGLSIAHEIVSAHGGRIEVTSQLGEGTAFVVRLPCSGAASNGAVAAPDHDSPRSEREPMVPITCPHPLA